MKHIGKSPLKKTKNAEVVEKSGLKTTIVRLIFRIIHTRTHHQWDSKLTTSLFFLLLGRRKCQLIGYLAFRKSKIS